MVWELRKYSSHNEHSSYIKIDGLALKVSHSHVSSSESDEMIFGLLILCNLIPVEVNFS